jgi:hypothetical protein
MVRSAREAGSNRRAVYCTRAASQLIKPEGLTFNESECGGEWAATEPARGDRMFRAEVVLTGTRPQGNEAPFIFSSCSGKIATRVKRDGYRVLYREFDGPHTV